jgi:hypothetical protein
MSVWAFALMGAAFAPAMAGSFDPPATSAERCGACHRAIHEAWKSSSHSRAMESRLFQDALEMAAADYGPAARKTCLGCHAPVAVQTGDLALINKVSWEGVTCDFCHGIRDVSLAGQNPSAHVQFTHVKAGPMKDSVSTGHGTEHSALHSTSALCAPCHEYRNAGGFPVLTTYSEWKESGHAAEGKQCQSCHMYSVDGDVVDARIKRSRGFRVNLHQMPGSHSIEQLGRTIRAQLAAVREGEEVKVTVDVTNHGAGHYVPTGSPLRQLVLEVRAEQQPGGRFREERVYTRRIADDKGTPLEREHAVFMRGARVLSDTRLSPGEKRTETFVFPAPPGVRTRVRATFWYYYSPMAQAESRKRVTFLTLNRLVP